MFNVLLLYNDIDRYWTPGSYLKRLLAQDPQYDVVGHARIAEDVDLIVDQNLKIDLALVIDSGGPWFKLHHHTKSIKEKGIKTAVWWSDLHRNDWASWRLQVISEFRYDHVFVCQKPFIEMIKQRNYEDHQIYWLPHAVDPSVFIPMPQIEKKYDIGYVGYMNDRRRHQSLILKELMNFKEYHTRWELDAARCINECKIGWNCSVTDLDYANMRVFETLACKVPLLVYCNRKEHAGLLDLFEDGKHLFVYESEDELRELSVRLLMNPDLRESVVDEGYRAVVTHHSYKNRLNTLLDTMGFPLLK